MAQDFTAIPSLFFLLAIILLGARVSGRLKSIQGLRISNPLGVHKKFGVFFAILVIVTFVIGLWGQIFHGEPLFWEDTEPSVAMIHGWLGLVITILALLHVVPSIGTKDRRKTRRLHLIFGYMILAVLVVQILLGFWAALGSLTGE
jgi:magnesium-transporting ATPase (P-type)